MVSLPYKENHWPWVQDQFPDGIDLAVELGSFTGQWANGLLENCDVKRLFCIDHWIQGPKWTKWMEKMRKHESKVVPIPGFSIEVASRFFHIIDLLYIDANHRRVLEDLKVWWPHVKMGGVVLLHDWNLGGVRNSIKRFFHNRGIHIEEFGPLKKNYSAWVRKDETNMHLATV